MKSLSKRSRSAADWPSTPEIDGETWELGPEPTDARWAAENLNADWHSQDEPTPDEIIDRQAEEAEALDRYERGLCL